MSYDSEGGVEDEDGEKNPRKEPKTKRSEMTVGELANSSTSEDAAKARSFSNLIRNSSQDPLTSTSPHAGLAMSLGDGRPVLTMCFTPTGTKDSREPPAWKD